MSRLILGAGNTLYQADSQDAFTGSAEPAGVVEVLTHPVYPHGPSGDCVFRRLYVALQYSNGISLTVTPIIGGTVLSQDAQFFHRPGSGRVNFWMALNQRASYCQVRLHAVAPPGSWTVEKVEFFYQNALRARRVP
jgi:hypothetical protein